MRVTLLGTGGSAGVPMIGGVDGRGDWGACDPAEPRNVRTRSSILIEDGETSILVDTSPDLRAQMLACAVRRVDAIVYTHAHADHIGGVDDIRLLNRIVDRPIDAYGTRRTLDDIERRFDYAFRPWQPPGFFRPVLTPREVRPGDVIPIGRMQVRLFDQDHGFMHTLGLRVGGFGYSTDVVALDEAALRVLEGVQTWVVGCFQRDPPHRTHAWLDRVGEWAERLRPARTVLTHMGPDMDWAWLRAHLPARVEPGHDGQILHIGEHAA